VKLWGELRAVLAGGVIVMSILTLGAPAAARAALSLHDYTPFPPSKVIVGARWTSPRYGPPSNQIGDILPTVWADDGAQYVMIDDGGTDVPVAGGLWRQSMARITGTPPHLRFSHVGNPFTPPPHTWSQIHRNPSVWRGPLGPVYSSGLLAVDHVFYATEERDWDWGTNGLFAGLDGIARSYDHGNHWSVGEQSFPAPLGNLNWVVRGRDGPHPDGYVYAIASEREFNADRIVMGRSGPSAAEITDPSRWQWISGWQQTSARRFPTWSSSLGAAVPVAAWPGHFTYPQMSYDAPLHGYLLTFTYSYAKSVPGIWMNGSQLVILEAAHPWGPFSFVAGEAEFGPSNGYDPGFPVKWISPDGRDLWLKWAANFDGCRPGLDCSGTYGFNYRRIHLTVAGGGS
jgi:hypothetical protein